MTERLTDDELKGMREYLHGMVNPESPDELYVKCIIVIDNLLLLRQQNKMLQTKLDDAYSNQQNLAESCSTVMIDKDAKIQRLVEAGDGLMSADDEFSEVGARWRKAKADTKE
jgi:hypothetical protein